MVSQAHGTTDQWMVSKVVLHHLVPLGDRLHSEETIKEASATLMSKYLDDDAWSIILGYLWFLTVRHKKCMNMILYVWPQYWP